VRQVDGEGQIGTLLILVGAGASIMAFAEEMFPLGLFSVFALIIGAITTWDDWGNKQKWMNYLLREIARLIGKEDLD